MTATDTTALQLPTWVRVLLTAVGLGATAAGTTAVLSGDDGAGSAALVTFGLALLALGVLAGHVRSFRAGGLEIEIARREQAENALRDLISGLAAPLGETYQAIREHVGAGPARTALLDEYFDVVARQAPFGHFEPGEVAALFRAGGDGGRIVSLALMWGDPSTVNMPCVLDAVGSSRSAFEQSRGLWLAERQVASLSGAEQTQLRSAIAAGRHHIGGDTSRADIVSRLDRLLGM